MPGRPGSPPTGGQLTSDAEAQGLAVGRVGQSGGGYLEVREAVGVDALPGDGAQITEALDERTEGMAGEVAGPEGADRVRRRVESVLPAGAEPLGLVAHVVDAGVGVGVGDEPGGEIDQLCWVRRGAAEAHAARSAAL